MDSRGTHGSLMARDSIRERKPRCNCDRNWTGYSTGEVRTFLERDPVPGGCRVANTGYALVGLRPAGKALGGLDVRDGGPHQGHHLPPRSEVAAAEAVAVRQRRPVFTGPGRRRRPGPGRSTARRAQRALPGADCRRPSVAGPETGQVLGGLAVALLESQVESLVPAADDAFPGVAAGTGRGAVPLLNLVGVLRATEGV